MSQCKLCKDSFDLNDFDSLPIDLDTKLKIEEDKINIYCLDFIGNKELYERRINLIHNRNMIKREITVIIEENCDIIYKIQDVFWHKYGGYLLGTQEISSKELNI